MPIDSQKFNAPATRGDVAGVALRASMAVRELVWALGQPGVVSDEERKAHLQSAENIAIELDEAFNELVGWTSGA